MAHTLTTSTAATATSRTLPASAPAATAPQAPQAPRTPTKPLCTSCGTDDHDAFQVLSRHRTSVGTTVWLRCTCDAIQVRVVSRAGAQIVARGRRP